jgi:hypothetical protein
MATMSATADADGDRLAAVRAEARRRAEAGDLTGARALMEDALAEGELRLGPDHLTLTQIMVDLATIARELGNFTESQNQLRRAYAIICHASGRDDAAALSVEGRLAAVSHRLGDPTDAMDWHLADVGARVLGDEHAAVRGARQRLARPRPAESPPEPAMPLSDDDGHVPYPSIGPYAGLGIDLEPALPRRSIATSPYDLANRLPHEGAAPHEGTAPHEGAAPHEGTAPHDGAFPHEGGLPHEGSADLDADPEPDIVPPDLLVPDISLPDVLARDVPDEVAPTFAAAAPYELAEPPEPAAPQEQGVAPEPAAPYEGAPYEGAPYELAVPPEPVQRSPYETGPRLPYDLKPDPKPEPKRRSPYDPPIAPAASGYTASPTYPGVYDRLPDEARQPPEPMPPTVGWGVGPQDPPGGDWGGGVGGGQSAPPAGRGRGSPGGWVGDDVRSPNDWQGSDDWQDSDDPRAFDPRAFDPRVADPRVADPRAFDQCAFDQRPFDQQPLDQRAFDRRALDDQRASDGRGLPNDRVASRPRSARELNPRDANPRHPGSRQPGPRQPDHIQSGPRRQGPRVAHPGQPDRLPSVQGRPLGDGVYVVEPSAPAGYEGAAVWDTPPLAKYAPVLARPRRSYGGAALAVSLGLAVLLAGGVVIYRAVKASGHNLTGSGAVESTAAADPSATSSPTAPLATAAPAPVTLTDDGGSVTLSWPDPSAGQTPFIVAGGRAGSPSRPLVTIPRGQQTSTIYGLNKSYNYCFTVTAVYSSAVTASSPQVCTARKLSGATPPGSPAANRPPMMNGARRATADARGWAS